MKQMQTKRRILEGIVISDKMTKTIVVEVVSRLQHPTYHKAVKNRKRYKAHDPEEKAKIGNHVRIIESRPISKEKHYRLLEVLP